MAFDEHKAAAQTKLGVLALREVSVRRRGAALLDKVSLRFGATGCTALMGANGAGKSLALRVAQGVLAPCEGAVAFDNAPLGAAGRRRLGLSTQRPVVLRRSARGNLAHALSVYGLPRAERSDRIDALLDLAQLTERADAPAQNLSGGEQQRLCIVRALAADPDILLLDEPTASLDPQATLAVEALIRAARAKGVRIGLVTHDAAQARRLADDVVFLHRGRVVEHAPASSFFVEPRSAAARAYLEGRLFV